MKAAFQLTFLNSDDSSLCQVNMKTHHDTSQFVIWSWSHFAPEAPSPFLPYDLDPFYFLCLESSCSGFSQKSSSLRLQQLQFLSTLVSLSWFLSSCSPGPPFCMHVHMDFSVFFFVQVDTNHWTWYPSSLVLMFIYHWNNYLQINYIPGTQN